MRLSTQTLSFKTADGSVQYIVKHRARVTRRLHMELDEDGGLVVIVPKHWSKRQISATLMQHPGRVQNFLANARQRQLAALQYCQAEEHLYLGQRYPLALTQRRHGTKPVELLDGKITIDSDSHEPEKIRASLQHWYQGQALQVFNERLQAVAMRAPWTKARRCWPRQCERGL